MADPTVPQTPDKQAANVEANLRLALGILTACAQDVAEIERAVPPSKRNGIFIRAIASLRQRIATGEQMTDEHYAR